jgi:chemotaxis-related protein WspD
MSAIDPSTMGSGPATSATAAVSQQDASGNLQDCWNEIGTQGNASCPELANFVQCRNCPVHARAAVLALNRPLPSGYRDEWTERFAQTAGASPAIRNSAVIFRVGLEWLALPTHVLQEFAEHRPVHSIPHRRQGILVGVVNIRGELLLCVSLGRVLAVDEGVRAEPPQKVYDRLLVVHWDAQRLVFPVDEVHGIHRYYTEELAAPPATLARSGVSCADGVLPWRGRSVGLLNADQLFLTVNRNLS